MTTVIITLAVLLVIGVVIAKEYAKFKEEQKEQTQIEIFKEEERLAQIPPPVFVEEPKPLIEAVKSPETQKIVEAIKIEEKPKRKYATKKRPTKTPKK